MKAINRFFDIREGEFQPASFMFGLFFAVITVFQILKPLKKGLFVAHIGPERELIAKGLNIDVAFMAMVGFTWLYNRLGGRRLVYLLSGLFLVALLIFWGLVNDDPSQVVNWSFYLFGDLWSTVWVATFWAFLNEISTEDQSKRLYGLIGAGGVIGGLLGSTLVVSLVQRYSARPLILLCAVLTVLIPLVIWQTDRLARQPHAALAYRQNPTKLERVRTNAAIEGAKLALRSRYLLAVVGIIGFYEFCSQILDFQFSTVLKAGISGGRATQAFVANVYLLTDMLSVVIQIFLTSFLMRRFGLEAGLIVLPMAIALASGAFWAAPSLLLGCLLSILDNGLNYSINQTARETLFVPTSTDEQYKARAFTNMFVQRAGKGVATLISGAFILIGIRWLSPITLGITLLWIGTAIFAARYFRQLSREREYLARQSVT